MELEQATPTRQAVRKRLAILMHEIAGVPLEQITETASVDNEIQMESVAFTELQVAIEEEYQIEIDPILILELNGFGAIADYVHGRIINGNGGHEQQPG
ncbi:MAG: acyl carrier protein [Deltaproteobacteria bacterium]|nr:acyl carrier protein [Deltaproteobacteria bacterium]